MWYVINSSNGSLTSRQCGAGYAPYNDIPVPGDYGGDGKNRLRGVARLNVDVVRHQQLERQPDVAAMRGRLRPVQRHPGSRRLRWGREEPTSRCGAPQRGCGTSSTARTAA